MPAHEWLNFLLCRNPQPFKGGGPTICGVIRFMWWEFVQLPVLRRWHLFRRRRFQIERPDLLPRGRTSRRGEDE